MRTKAILGVLILAIACVLVTQQQRSAAQAQERPIPAADQSIISKLSEIVVIRERLSTAFEESYRAGRAPADFRAEIDLAEARIELARERGQRDATVAELKSLVTAHERRLARVRTAAMDRLPQADVDRAKAALLEAEVRLLRAQR